MKDYWSERSISLESQFLFRTTRSSVCANQGLFHLSHWRGTLPLFSSLFVTCANHKSFLTKYRSIICIRLVISPPQPRCPFQPQCSIGAKCIEGQGDCDYDYECAGDILMIMRVLWCRPLNQPYFRRPCLRRWQLRRKIPPHIWLLPKALKQRIF